MGKIAGNMGTIEASIMKGEGKMRQNGDGFCKLTVLLIVVGVVFVGLAVSVAVSLYAVAGPRDNAGTEGNGTPTVADGTTPQQGPLISVSVTVENIVTNDDTEFRATKQLKTTRKSAYEIMRDLEKMDSRFRFTTKEHKVFGHYVTHVQGVESNWKEKTYWAFLKRTDTVDCLVPLGVSSYIPSDGEHLVLSLQKSPNILKSCLTLAKTTQAPPDWDTTASRTTQAPDSASSTPSGPQMSVVLTFENLATNDRREFRATTDLNTTRKTAYEIMRDIEKTDQRFRFTTKEHKDYGHYVTHVQGVKSDWNEKTYWAFLRRTDTVDCLVPLGVSSYVPSDGEHLVLSLVRFPNNLKSCLTLAKTTTPPEMTTTV